VDVVIDLLHLSAGADKSVARNWRLGPLLNRLELTLQGIRLAGAKQHALQIADRGGPANVAESSKPHKFGCRGAKRVIRHDDHQGGRLSREQSRAALNLHSGRVLAFLEIDKDHLGIARSDGSLERGFVRRESDLETLA
jgi:hypothetical protein